MRVFMDDGAATLISLLICILLFIMHCVLIGFLAAAEHFNSVDVEEIEDKDMRKRVDEILDEEDAIRKTYLSYAAIDLIVTGILSALFFCPYCIRTECFANESVYVLCKVLFYAALIFVLTVFGGYVPFKLGERKAERWLTKYVGIVHAIILIFRPVTALNNGVSNLILPLFKADPHQKVDDITEDEIISIIDESHEQGMILESEAEMIHNILEFDDKDAFDVMTPRSNIIALDASTQFEEAYAQMLEENFSRYPVYTDDIDHIIGTIHIKDAMRDSRQKEYLLRDLASVPGLVREVDAVPETQNINELLRQMQKSKEHMANVVDEYGQTSGIITLEDILEEIVGEIEDEHDKEVALIVAQSNGNFLLNGMAPLDDVAETLHISIDVEDINTLNGFLISLIDKIPEDNETFSVDYDGYTFRILSASDKTIKTVLAIPKPDRQNRKEER